MGCPVRCFKCIVRYIYWELIRATSCRYKLEPLKVVVGNMVVKKNAHDKKL